DILLEAFRTVASRMPGARLRIVGEGSRRRILEELSRELGLADRVDFCGPVPHTDLPRIYSSASLYMQSSWYESQGMALLEAAASKLPVAGPAVGALADLASAGAPTAPTGDSEMMADLILGLLRDRGQCVERAEVIRAVVEQDYTAGRAADRFFDLY